MPVAKRKARHEAAIDLLHWCARHPMTLVTVEDLSSELYQSRTSLFKGAKEHFERTPLELQRSIRLDHVRSALLRGSGSIGAVAAEFGFQSRSHFARRYREQFAELPQRTADLRQL